MNGSSLTSVNLVRQLANSAVPPKYSAAEIERRWLVELSEVGDLSAFLCRDVEDLYVLGTRLRLRKIIEIGQSPIFKLGKKYGKDDLLTEQVVTIYLTEDEYKCLSVLRGAVVLKKRYSICGGSVDVYVRPHRGLAIFEVEFPSENAAHEYTAPSFARAEITGDARYSGYSLSQDAR